MGDALRGIAFVLLLGSGAGGLYLLLAALELARFGRRLRPKSVVPPVTILKPLCGEEPGLYENLRSFAALPGVQVVFGVRDGNDPAVAVVERLRRENPGADLHLVVDPSVHGTNFKVSNLLNMLKHARHDILVIADSDIRVSEGYLEALAGPLGEPGVGLVTCLYVARPEAGLSSRLFSLWVNHGFLPSALVAERLGAGKGCFGATLALRRETLDAVGGFFPLRDVLADDYALGAAVLRSGQRVVLSNRLVDMVVSESFRGLVAHELRWLRTIRSVEPWGYLGLTLTHPVALAVLSVLLSSGGWWPAWAALAFAVLSRLALARTADRALGLPPSPPPLSLVRDALSFSLFLGGFFGSRIVWREQRLRVQPGGALTLDGGTLR